MLICQLLTMIYHLLILAYPGSITAAVYTSTIVESSLVVSWIVISVIVGRIVGIVFLIASIKLVRIWIVPTICGIISVRISCVVVIS